jgi:hypothetical protein
MILTNAQSAIAATENSMPESAAKTPGGAVASGAKVAVVKPTVTEPKTSVAPVERGTTQRRRVTVKSRNVSNAKQSTSGEPVAKKLPAANAGKAKPAAPPAKPIVARKDSAPKKVGKVKVIRDSVTMPLEDYERIAALKQKCLAIGIAIKKSELLRAGLITLQRLSDEDLKRVLALVDKIKTGRPAGKVKKNKAGKKERK